MISAIVLLIQPSALAAGLLLVVMSLVSWAAAVPLINFMPHINARGVRSAPQQACGNPYKYLAELKRTRRTKRAAAAAEAREAGSAAEAAAAGSDAEDA
jgi:hypothetical protein